MELGDKTTRATNKDSEHKTTLLCANTLHKHGTEDAAIHIFAALSRNKTREGGKGSWWIYII